MKTKLLILFLICSQISFGQGLLMAASGTSLMKGLVAGWEFDETSGTTAKDGVSGWYPGTINSNVGFVSGKIGNAFDFYTNDSCRVSTTCAITTNAFSLQMWINIKAKTQVNARYFNANGILVYKGTGTTSSIQANFGTTIGYWVFNTPSENSWHQIVFTYDYSNVNNNPIVYVDGSSITVTNTTAPVGTSPTFSALNIGNRPTLANYFQGYIDEPLLWNRILSSTEVSTLYTLTNSGKNINDL